MGADVDLPRLYDEFADWFHLLTSPGEYLYDNGKLVRFVRRDGVYGVSHDELGVAPLVKLRVPAPDR